MKKILIIGAASAIAESVERLFAKRGDQLFLVARDKEQLDKIKKDLLIRGAYQVNSYQMDARHFDQHLLMLDKAFEILGKIDIVLIAYGTLSNQSDCEKSVDLALEEIKVNALSVISLLTHLANRFEKQQSGTIAVIGSVAGDRGRQSNYVYGSSKAMLEVFLSGLRQRLYKSGISVITIKPGFVNTPMTRNFKKGILWTSPEKIAHTIVNACDSKSREIYVPYFWLYIMFIIKLIPTAIFKKIRL